MSKHRIQPYFEERRQTWRNRVADWRERSDETLFLAAASTALLLIAIFLISIAWQKAADVVTALRAAAPLRFLLIATVLMSVHQAWTIRRQRALWQRHWLAQQPIAESLRIRLLCHRLLMRMLAGIGLGALGAHLASLAPADIAAWATACVIAALIGWRLGFVDHAGTPNQRRELVFNVSGQGTLMRWQWIEVAAVLSPYRLKRSLWLILLVPTGHWSAFVIMIFLLLSGVLVMAWSRSLAMIPAAHRWLNIQPITPAQLLLGCTRLPALVFAAMAALSMVVLTAGAMQHAIPIVIAALAAISILHFCCVAAERQRPRRIGLLFALHTIVLIAVLQTMPILLPIVWVLMITRLLRKGLHR